jgi:adenine-specific DNA-methyltransferase
MPPRRTAPAGPTPVDAIVHGDKRANLPTADAHDLITPEIESRVTVSYPREIHSPMLVWQGKEALDDADLEADAPPIYIQEKVDPRVLIEHLRHTAKAGEAEPELTLFETFDGLGDLDLVEFYRHEANWSNRMILGDSLQVMASLDSRERLRGKVQMIYLDPPYGIKFGSNWQVSARKREVKDGKVEDIAREVEQIKAFRDTWELGIHSYLSYLRDRLLVARDLLTDSGSLFVQIGDERTPGEVASRRGLRSGELLRTRRICNYQQFQQPGRSERRRIGVRSPFVVRQRRPLGGEIPSAVPIEGAQRSGRQPVPLD